MQMKTTMRYLLISVKMTMIVKSTNNKCRRGYGESGAFSTLLQERTLGAATRQNSMAGPQRLRAELILREPTVPLGL